MIALVFAFDKLKSYLVGANVVAYNEHVAITSLFYKKDAQPRLIILILLL